MKINVFYKDIKIGELTKIQNFYEYKANIKNIKRAENLGFFALIYGLNKSFKTNEIPLSIISILPENKNSDLYKLAMVDFEKDNEFTILYKMSKLKIEKPSFHIEAE